MHQLERSTKNTNLFKPMPVIVRNLLIGLMLVAFGLPAPAWSQDNYTMQIARIKYNGGGDWYSDEQSLSELIAFAREESLLDIAPREEIVELGSDKVFSYPYLYLTGHGNVRFSNQEAQRLRNYLQGGGFLHIDDNYGLDKHIRREMKKVFPEKEFTEIPFNHPVFSTHYSFSNGLPKIHEHDGNPPQGFGIFIEDRLVVFYSFESDLGDGWEPAEVHNVPDEKRLSALRMGVNLLTYAMMN